ncbi:MAG: hypothetical protein QOJ29_2497 [Thermoleophilaceae bacterium]|nr:hypothetical protein [Thermoleophilaceae bacterium]
MRLPLGIPVIPARAALQAFDDLHAIAEAARRLPSIEARLTQQFEVLNRQAEQIVALGDRIIEQGARLHERGGEILSHSDRLDVRAEEVLAESLLVREAAREVAERGAEVAAALPALQQIVTTTEPLQGAIERFGRLVDRLPGSRP